MAHLTGKNMGLKIDSSTGVLTDISGSVNSQSLEHAIEILEDTGIADTTRSTLQGLANFPTITLNGWVNTTIDGIFGPVANGTAITKTVQFQVSSALFYNFESWVNGYTISGTPDTLQTWSVNLSADTVDNYNRTSKSL